MARKRVRVLTVAVIAAAVSSVPSYAPPRREQQDPPHPGS
jgi:hypothetical protein